MIVWTHGGQVQTDPFLQLLGLCDLEKLERVRAGFAFVSLLGARRLRTALESDDRLLGCPKEICVGIHQGISEPKAVELLRSIPNTSVRIFLPTSSMTAESLLTRPVYHPKFVAILANQGEDCWMIGSANLTGAAISVTGTNVEIASIASIKGKQRKQARESLEVWEAAFSNMARLATDKLIKSYAAARLITLQKNPALLELTEASPELGDARDLFIEVGKGSGMERHQVEFTRQLATFFGKPRSSRKDLRLANPATTWKNRPLTPKKTSYGVTIYRLGMPTVKKGGEKVAGRAIRFTRTKASNRFLIEIADLGSPSYIDWESHANAQGHLGKTSGGRKFGYTY